MRFFHRVQRTKHRSKSVPRKLDVLSYAVRFDLNVIERNVLYGQKDVFTSLFLLRKKKKKEVCTKKKRIASIRSLPRILLPKARHVLPCFGFGWKRTPPRNASPIECPTKLTHSLSVCVCLSRHPSERETEGEKDEPSKRSRVDRKGKKETIPLFPFLFPFFLGGGSHRKEDGERVREDGTEPNPLTKKKNHLDLPIGSRERGEERRGGIPYGYGTVPRSWHRCNSTTCSTNLPSNLVSFGSRTTTVRFPAES